MTPLWTYPLPPVLEHWLKDASPMRNLSSAGVRWNISDTGTASIIIDHALLDSVTPRMLAWWMRFFCYQTVQISQQIIAPAFWLWHPQDHFVARITRHSLSGELGLVRGAHLTLTEKYGSHRPHTWDAKIVRATNRQRIIELTSKQIYCGRLIENFHPHRFGMHIQSQLIFSHAGKASESQLSNLFNTSFVQAWIKHKVEAIGNLATILPPIYAVQARRFFATVNSQALDATPSTWLRSIHSN